MLFFWILSKLPPSPLPLPKIGTTCTTFFRRQNSRFECQFRTKNSIFTTFIYTYQILYTYNLKKSLEFKSLAFWRKQFPFIDQKCTYEKVPKNLGRALPPSFGQNPKEQQFPFPFPILYMLGADFHWIKLATSECTLYKNVQPAENGGSRLGQGKV